MASTKLNGTDLGIYLGTTVAAMATGGTLLGAATSHTLSMQSEMADVTTKDSGGWKEIIPTLKSFTIDVDALLTYDETYGFESLFDALINRTPLYFRLSSEDTGDEKFYGQCYITSLEQNNPMEDATTYTASFEGTGILTRATIT